MFGHFLRVQRRVKSENNLKNRVAFCGQGRDEPGLYEWALLDSSEESAKIHK